MGIVAFFYGYYGVASGWLGLWTLVVLAAASVGVLGLFRGRSKGIAGVNYQMCLVAIWYGHLNGTMALGGALDIGWFCISFLWPWLLFAVIGGIALASSRKIDSPSRRTTRVAAGVLLAAAGLVVCGFAQLRFFREQPVVMFRAVRFFLQGIAFSPDGRFLAYGTDRGTIEQSELGDEKATRSLSCFAHDGVNAIVFSPDGTLLACAGGDERSTKVIDANRWTIVAALKTWGGRRTECLAFSSDGGRLATGDANGRVGVWDTTKWIAR